MSYACCQSARMQSDEQMEQGVPVEDLKRTLAEWEHIASAILVLLQDEGDDGANWRPHLEQIRTAVQRYRDVCLHERAQLGLWRRDGLAPGEVYERLWEQGDRLAKWLQRMMQ